MGAPHRAPEISTLALVYAPAEYCAPVWCRSSHAHKIDVMLNESHTNSYRMPEKYPGKKSAFSGWYPSSKTQT